MSSLFKGATQVCILCGFRYTILTELLLSQSFKKIKINREELFSTLRVKVCLHKITETWHIYKVFYKSALIRSTGKECLNCICLFWSLWYSWKNSELEIECGHKLLIKAYSTKKVFQPCSIVIASMTTLHLGEKMLGMFKKVWLSHLNFPLH